MARVKRFDERAVKNRNRVQRHRNLKKLRMIHEKEISERISSKNMVDCEMLEDSKENNACHENVDKATEIKDKLRFWALNHRITKVALNDLLSILIFAGFGFLPKDSRTLMGTPAKTPITPLSQGKMWYHGIQKCLENVFAGILRDISVTLDFNFDGLPISKSSNMQFWPILSSIRGKHTPRV